MPMHYFCVHGHFYQPPREDPISGAIPQETGAEPYRNWNERIHAECYRPNAELGNFERISFNVGPTLNEWMYRFDPETGRKITAQARVNFQRYGVSNAMAQAYNHAILPLARQRDKETQVVWGIADYIHRMGHKPQGMWLPETAVDLDTLSVMAEKGINFTILAPWQADTSSLDVTEPYLVSLPGGRSITVFFYQRELSTAVSFNPMLTENADFFVESQTLNAFQPEKKRKGEPQLILVASDGELYGHHQKFRDRFLNRLVDGASSGRGVAITYPALWLREHPARQTMAIRERTSWSCHHGVTRWSGSCACTTGGGDWKRALRQAMDHLADEIDGLYAGLLRSAWIDPWALRNRYVEVMLKRTSAEQLIEQAAGRALPTETLRQIRLMLEAQNQRQRMFTSCGWYFDDFSRIEPRNNVAYAAQAISLTWQAVGVDLSRQFGQELEDVRSNRRDLCGAEVLQRYLARLGR